MFCRTWNGVCPDTRYLHASDRIFFKEEMNNGYIAKEQNTGKEAALGLGR